MARRFALHFDVRVVVEADDADGARAALEQGVEDLAAAHETAADCEECPEASALVAALDQAVYSGRDGNVLVAEMPAAGAA